MKRNVMISGEFTLSEMTSTKKTVKVASSKKNAKARLEALKAAGVDTSNYFAMGDEMVIKVVEGVPMQVADDDPIFNAICQSGYLNHYKLFRRIVMAQMFHMLRKMEQSGETFNGLLQQHGYEYSWRMVENELHAQSKMEKHGDAECLFQRSRWFNKRVIAEMMIDYINALNTLIEKHLMYSDKKKKGDQKTFRHKCKGIPYIRLAGKNIFVSDIPNKVFAPLCKLRCKMLNADSVDEMYRIVYSFNRMRKRLSSDTKQSYAFIYAYKGSGAYFTMRNLIMFHGARFNKMNEKKSLEYVEQKAEEYAKDGWRMMGVMKELIVNSGISIQGKIDEWHKRR